MAKDLPSKTIVDVLCPLSALQQEMYITFQKGLRLSDDRLEPEIVRIKRKKCDLLDDIELAAHTKTNANAKQEDTQFPDLMAAFRPQSGNRTGKKSAKEIEDAPLALHPLRALLYLKLLCVHPCLAVSSDHTQYRQRLVNDVSSSCKLARLGKLYSIYRDAIYPN